MNTEKFSEQYSLGEKLRIEAVKKTKKISDWFIVILNCYIYITFIFVL